MDEGGNDAETAIDVRLLVGDEAEIVDARQAAMVDDEFEIGEGCGDIVDVADVEGVHAQGMDGRALVDMDDVDAEGAAFLEVAADMVLLQGVALGLAAPFGGVELDAAKLPAGMVGLQPFEPLLPVARVEAAAEDDLFRRRLLERGVLLGGVEPVLVEFPEIGRQENGHVAMTILEEVLERALDAVVLEALPRPARFRRAHADMGVPEALDEGEAVAVGAVLRPRIPEMGVAVDDENLRAVFRAIQMRLPRRRFWRAGREQQITKSECGKGGKPLARRRRSGSV